MPRKREGGYPIYLQPAALSLRAYILPMSPMPIRPTTKFSIPFGCGDGFVMVCCCQISRKIEPEERFTFSRPSSSRGPGREVWPSGGAVTLGSLGKRFSSAFAWDSGRKDDGIWGRKIDVEI